MAHTNTIHAGMGRHPVYLWTLPMFHCNGWCFPWTLAVQAGTHVCLRWVRAKAMFDAIADHGVTHLCGAPIVMSMLIVLMGLFTIARMPTDIFPVIDIPVITVVWNYGGLPPEEMEKRTGI